MLSNNPIITPNDIIYHLNITYAFPFDKLYHIYYLFSMVNYFFNVHNLLKKIQTLLLKLSSYSDNLKTLMRGLFLKVKFLLMRMVLII